VSDTAGVGRQTETYGASWGDINGDHYPDLFLNNHRLRPSMYLNLGDGTFYDTAGEVATWVNRSTADQHGASFADFDNDGDQDLLVSLGTGNPNQFFVNHYGALLDRTAELGIGFDSIGGRLPVWLDYNGDGLLDVVLTQFGGAAKVFRQTAGAFVEATSETQMLCLRFHFGMLLDVQGDGRLDFVCPDDASFPQRIYDTSTLPWMNITSALPKVPIVADAIIADFDNNQRMDMFLINNVQLRPSGATRVDDHTIEASLSGGEKGFNFISDGPITIDLDWNKLEDGFGLPKIRIGDSAVNPSQIPFTLDPADPNVLGMAPSDPAAAPLMRLGFDAAQRRWTIIAQTENLFSEAYYVVLISLRRSPIFRCTIRRSISSCCSPGPRVPMPVGAPPTMRSRCDHMARSLGYVYSSWAYSTCSLASLVCARAAKISRISSLRSSTLHSHTSSMLAICEGERSFSNTTT
jgi:hypothetical protein